MASASPIVCEDVSGPIHQHDCEDCVYLGSTRKGSQLTDHYWCEQSTLDMPTLIQRFGSDGPDYSNLPVSLARSFATQGVKTFDLTYRRAVDQGLCK